MNANKRPTILIVDDDRPQRDGLQRALADRYAVLVADELYFNVTRPCEVALYINFVATKKSF